MNTVDADGDDVRCRWSVVSAECGGVCKGLPRATLEAVRLHSMHSKSKFRHVFRILALFTMMQAVRDGTLLL